MTKQLSVLVVLFGLISYAVGCGNTPNPYYCKGRNPDDNCTEPVVCMDNSICAAPTGVCNTQTMTCVQCTSAMSSACTGTSPVCGADNACHACTAHSDCTASHVCLSDGSCATLANVAYVSAAPDGMDNVMCSPATPCASVAAALATGRPYVKVHGIIDGPVLIGGGRSVTFLGDPGAMLTRTTGTGPIITVQDDRTLLSIYDTSISNAPNSGGGFGILISPGSAPTVSLTRVTIAKNPGGGISSAGATLSVVQSRISGNQGGGILISGGTFVIVGNVFSGNGGPGSSVGGVSITAAGSPTNRLEFNSFNQNQTGAPIGQAVQCSVASFTAKNNIMSDNGTITQTDQFTGSCNHAYSISHPGPLPPGLGNGISDPLFVDPTKGDLHLQANSPARRAADPASDLTGIAAHDIDGNARVAPADIGAYQFR